MRLLQLDYYSSQESPPTSLTSLESQHQVGFCACAVCNPAMASMPSRLDKLRGTSPCVCPASCTSAPTNCPKRAVTCYGCPRTGRQLPRFEDHGPWPPCFSLMHWSSVIFGKHRLGCSCTFLKQSRGSIARNAHKAGSGTRWKSKFPDSNKAMMFRWIGMIPQVSFDERETGRMPNEFSKRMRRGDTRESYYNTRNHLQKFSGLFDL